MTVSCSIGYYIKPLVLTTLCDDDPVGDATACFNVYTLPGGSIEIYAYHQKYGCSCSRKGWKISCSCKVYLKCICNK